MDIAEVVAAILARGKVAHVEAHAAYFFFFDPGPGQEVDQRLPFATIVTDDAHDPASNLSRPGTYRLNIGVTRETYERLFGPPPPASREMPVVETGHDYTRLDHLMPHPVYSPLSWVCVLNPSEATFWAVQPLLDEAQAVAARRAGVRASRTASLQGSTGQDSTGQDNTGEETPR